MKTEKRKIIPSYIYQKAKTPESSPEVIKKKLKFQNVITQDRTQFLDTLSQTADESINETQLLVQGEPKTYSTTSTNELTFVGTMTKEELNNHIQKCLEMSSEGKITPKNAFALQLIDCMNLLLQKEDFSVMACTLDAGQKIYAYRVDSLHQQVVKLAEEVITNQKSKERGDRESREDESGKKMKNEQRKPSKKNTLAAPESLRRNIKSKDPKERFIKIDGLPGAIMSSVRRDPADLSFTLENNVPFWHNWEKYKPHIVNGTVTIPHCEIYREKKELRERNNLLRFTAAQEETDTVANDMQMPSQEESLDDIIMDELVFNDMPIDVEENDDNKSNAMEVDVISTAIKRLNDEAEENKEICNAPSRFGAMKMIFNGVSDYDYLNMNKAYYWAGPEFWKRPKTTSFDYKERKKVSRKKKDPNSISYTGPAAEEMINRVLKKGSTLSKKAIMGWKMKNVTYATDLKIDVRQIVDLFHMSVSNEFGEDPEADELKNNTVGVEKNSDTNDCLQDNDASETSDSEDLLNSCFYESAPENIQSPDHGDPLNSAFYDAGLTQKSEIVNTETGKIIKVQFSRTTNNDESLVPVPKMVNFEPLKYKSKPIRVDMQHLKQTMWGVINEDIDSNKVDRRENTGGNLKPTQGQGTKFSSVLEQLPTKLEKRTAEDLSPGMALLALLTLANENNLQLKNTKDLSDVDISFENEN